MKHRLIIVDGISTVGKSTISQYVYKQVSLHEPVLWLHEECILHPIRHQEFLAGDLFSVNGMEKNTKAMLTKWKCFCESIIADNKVYIAEGCLLHTYDRYFVYSVLNDDNIISYFSQLMDIISCLNPLIIFLYRPNIKESLIKAFHLRGDSWRNLILEKPENHKYFVNNDYENEDSIFQSKTFEQDKMEMIFSSFQCDKIKINTSNESWEKYVREIVNIAGYQYKRLSIITTDLLKYCGTYCIQNGTDLWKIDYSKENNCIFSSLFWPFMPMQYINNNVFELISFPIELHFFSINNVVCFSVYGNYDWDYNGKIFERSQTNF